MGLDLESQFVALRQAAFFATVPCRKQILSELARGGSGYGGDAPAAIYDEGMPFDYVVCHFLAGTSRMPGDVDLVLAESGGHRFASEEDAEDFVACHAHYARLKLGTRAEATARAGRCDWGDVRQYLMSLIPQVAEASGNLSGLCDDGVSVDRRVVPSGTYLVEITGHRWNNANAGNLSLQLDCTVVAPQEFAGSVRPIHLNLVSDNPEAQEHYCGMLKAILEQAGIERLSDASQLHGKLINTYLVVKPHGYYGVPENAHRVVAVTGGAHEQSTSKACH